MKRLTVIMLACLLLAGCGGEQSVEGFAPAERERLVIYTSHQESVYGPVVREFEERTGIWVQIETGGTAELLDRLEEERDAPRCDLLFGGGVDSLTARRELFESYVSALAEELDPAYLCGDGSWTAFSVLPVVLIYNPVLVRMNLPEGWRSLLDPVWRGRIAFASPEVSGLSYTALAAMLQVLPEEGTLEAFYRSLEGRTLSGIGEVMDTVANTVAEGGCAIGVTTEAAALEAAGAGRDVALLYPAEGTAAIPDGMAVVSGCVHGDNARRFIDFCLGEDVQSLLASLCRRPVRRDLELLPEGAGEPVLLDYDLDRAANERDAVLERWRELEEAS